MHVYNLIILIDHYTLQLKISTFPYEKKILGLIWTIKLNLNTGNVYL